MPDTALDKRFYRIAFDDDGTPRHYTNVDALADLSRSELRDRAQSAGVLNTLGSKATKSDLVLAIIKARLLPDYDLIGTAEVAELLRVERPRIGRWMGKGQMPMPRVWPAAGPMWHREDIEAMVEAVESRRKQRIAA